MANLSSITSHRSTVFPVFTTQHFEQTVLRDFYRLRPEIFNKTNGARHRRRRANPYVKPGHDAIEQDVAG